MAIKPSAFLQKFARDNTNLLGETYHCMAVIRFGASIAKISAAPLSANVKALTGKRIDEVGDTTMRDLVVEHFRREGAEYQLRAQLCVDLKHIPVEMRPGPRYQMMRSMLSGTHFGYGVGKSGRYAIQCLTLGAVSG